jgi:hypothetical protein
MDTGFRHRLQITTSVVAESSKTAAIIQDNSMMSDRWIIHGAALAFKLRPAAPLFYQGA